jgi:hypothetical protein
MRLSVGRFNCRRHCARHCLRQSSRFLLDVLTLQIYEPLRILPTKTCLHRARAPACGQVAGYHYNAASQATLRTALAIKSVAATGLILVEPARCRRNSTPRRKAAKTQGTSKTMVLHEIHPKREQKWSVANLRLQISSLSLSAPEPMEMASVQFPLTPALSPKERVPRRPSLGMAECRDWS